MGKVYANFSYKLVHRPLRFAILFSTLAEFLSSHLFFFRLLGNSKATRFDGVREGRVCSCVCVCVLWLPRCMMVRALITLNN